MEDIAIYDGKYMITCSGVVYNTKTGKVITQTPIHKNKNPYLRVWLNGNQKLIHFLVAENFVPGRTNEKKYVDHIDRCPLNNHYSNLRWVSRSENNRNRHGTGYIRNWVYNDTPRYTVFVNVVCGTPSTRTFNNKQEAENYKEQLLAQREINIKIEIENSSSTL